jgi:hypothetical protein
MDYQPSPQDLRAEYLGDNSDKLTIEERIAALCRRIIDEMFADAPKP